MYKLFVYSILSCFIFLACQADKPVTEKKVQVETSTESISEEEIQSDLITVISFDEYQAFINSLIPNETYVINFWATWCKPCVAELPYFELLLEKYQSQGLHVVLVSLDFSKDLEKKVLPFLEEKQLKSEVFLLNDTNYDDWLSKVDEGWSGAIPATLVLRKTTNTYSFYERSFDFEALEKIILPVLKP